MRYLILLLICFSGLLAGQGVGQGFTPSVGSASAGVVDSTRLVQDSILQYWRDGVVVGGDTIKGKTGPQGIQGISGESTYSLESPNLNFKEVTEKTKAGTNWTLLWKTDSRGEQGHTFSAWVRRVGECYPVRGLSFPLAASTTFSPIGVSNQIYEISQEGTTKFNKTNDVAKSTNGLGVGFTSGASYTIKTTTDTLSHFSTARIFYKQPAFTSSCRVIVDGTNYDLVLDSSTPGETSFFVVNGYAEDHDSLRIEYLSGADFILYEGVFTTGKTGMLFLGSGNSGISSSLTSAYRGNLYLTDIYAPDLVYIRLGANDITGSTPELSALHIGRIIDTIQSTYLRAGIFIFTETDNLIPGSGDPELWNAAYAELARDKDVGLIDLHRHIPDWQRFKRYGLSLTADDAVHEGPNGAEYIVDAIYSELRNGAAPPANSGSGSSGINNLWLFDDASLIYSLDDTGITYKQGKVSIETGLSIGTTSFPSSLNIFEAYRSGVLRSVIDEFGRQTWTLTDGTSEYGTIAYAVPGGQPGIIFKNEAGTGRTDISFLEETGGLRFSTGTGTTAVSIAELRLNEQVFGRSRSSIFNITGRLIGGIGGEVIDGSSFGSPDNYISGSGKGIIRGSTSGDGPNTSTALWHSFTFDYQTKNDGTNATQFAIPYNSAISLSQGLFYQGRTSPTVTSGWYQIPSFLVSSLSDEDIPSYDAATNSWQPVPRSDIAADLRALIRSGTGSPEGSLTAPMGTLYLNLLGGTGTTLYIKESGTGNTGWIAK